MPRGVNSGLWAELEQLGNITLALLTDVDWLGRRVETVRFVNANTLERSISLDLDLPRMGQIVAGAGGDTSRPVAVPLTVISKGLLLDLDLRDGAGAALSVLSSEDDARASQAAMLAELRRGGTDVSQLSPAILQTIYDAARSFPSEADVQSLRDPAHVVSAIEAWQLAPDLSGAPGEAERWAKLLDTNENFWSWMVNFTQRFMLMTHVDLRNGPQLIKLRYIETQEPSHPGWREKLAIEPFLAWLEAPAVGMAAREHIHVEAPDGLFFDNDAHLWELRGVIDTAKRAEPATGRATYEKRITPERIAIYTAGLRQGAYTVTLTMRPKVAGFLRASSLTVLMTALLLLAGAAAQIWGHRLTPPVGISTEAAVALILVVPSIMSAYLAREGEHDLLSGLVRWPRIAVAATGVSALIAGGALVLQVAGTALVLVWLLAAGFCLSRSHCY